MVCLSRKVRRNDFIRTTRFWLITTSVIVASVIVGEIMHLAGLTLSGSHIAEIAVGAIVFVVQDTIRSRK